MVKEINSPPNLNKAIILVIFYSQYLIPLSGIEPQESTLSHKDYNTYAKGNLALFIVNNGTQYFIKNNVSLYQPITEVIVSTSKDH